MSKTLIALCSDCPQSGKSTIADRLEDKWCFNRVHFAGVLKEMLGIFLNAFEYDEPEISELLDGSRKNEPLERIPGRPTARQLMQTLGTEWGRNLVNEDVWVEAARQTILGIQDWDEGPIVIDDMRFPNELVMVHELGGKAIKVVRPGAKDTSGHASEGNLPDGEMDRVATFRGENSEQARIIQLAFADELAKELGEDE